MNPYVLLAGVIACNCVFVGMVVGKPFLHVLVWYRLRKAGRPVPFLRVTAEVPLFAWYDRVLHCVTVAWGMAVYLCLRLM